MIKLGLRAEDSFRMAKELGVVPLGAWRSLVRNLRKPNPKGIKLYDRDLFLSGKELENKKLKLGYPTKEIVKIIKSNVKNNPNTEYAILEVKNVSDYKNKLEQIY